MCLQPSIRIPCPFIKMKISECYTKPTESDTGCLFYQSPQWLSCTLKVERWCLHLYKTKRFRGNSYKEYEDAISDGTDGDILVYIWKVYMNFFTEREKIKRREHVQGLTLESRYGRGNQRFRGGCSQLKKEGGMTQAPNEWQCLGISPHHWIPRSFGISLEKTLGGSFGWLHGDEALRTDTWR